MSGYIYKSTFNVSTIYLASPWLIGHDANISKYLSISVNRMLYNYLQNLLIYLSVTQVNVYQFNFLAKVWIDPKYLTKLIIKLGLLWSLSEQQIVAKNYKALSNQLCVYIWHYGPFIYMAVGCFAVVRSCPLSEPFLQLSFLAIYFEEPTLSFV